MPIYRDCRVEVVCVEPGSCVAFDVDDADLRLDADGLELSFWDEEGAYVFNAPPNAEGHYQLVCRSRPRTGTLHRPTDEPWFVGAWRERDQRGYWRVQLGREESD